MESDSSVSELDPVLAEYRRLIAEGRHQAAEDLLRQNAELADSVLLPTPSEEPPTETRDDEGGFQLGGGVSLRGEAPTPLSPTRAHVPEDERPEDSVQLGKFGDFDLLEKIARGGMGLVFKARQLSLNRIVALKMIRHGRYTRPHEIQRFRAEAQAAAKLNHPNIVPVYEIGDVGGAHYYTMQFVDGPSLADLIRKGPLGDQAAARFARTIARTMHDAHERRVIHRDLKPSNILVDTTGQPRITDFGVAKVLDDAAPVAPGPIVGTPSYMSPEQSRSEDDGTGIQSDIYSIGAVLYALLTARPPFQAETDLETVIQLRTTDPVEPRLLNPGVPRDLQSICLKCLQKDPARRYATAGELAKDLDLFLAGRPTLARPAPRWERAWKTCRRNPVISLLALCAIMLATALIALLFWVNFQLRELNDELQSSKDVLSGAQVELLKALSEAQASNAAQDRLAYSNGLKDAGEAELEGDARAASIHLARLVPTPDQTDHRGGEWYLLNRRARQAHTSIFEDPLPMYFVLCAPDGPELYAAGRDAEIRVFDRTNPKLLRQWSSGQIEVNGLCLIPGEQTLASAGDDGSICLWSVKSDHGQPNLLRRIQAHERMVYNVIATPDGQTLISAGRDPIVRLWDPKTGDPKGIIDVGRAADVYTGAVALSTDGTRLASGDQSGLVAVTSLNSLETTVRLTTGAGKVNGLAWSPDGKWLAVASHLDVATIWNAESGERVATIPHLDAVLRARYLPDQSALVTADAAGTVHIWPLGADGTPRGTNEVRRWKAHRDRVYCLELCPDGHHLITCGSDGNVSSWNLHTPPKNWTLEKSEGMVNGMAFLPRDDGPPRLATVDEHRIELWNALTGKPLQTLHSGTVQLERVAVSADGTVLAAVGRSGHVDILELPAGNLAKQFELDAERNPDRLALSKDGSLLAIVNGQSTDGRDLVVIDTATGEAVKELAEPDCDAAAFSSDGRWLMAAGQGNTLIVWDLQTKSSFTEQRVHVNTLNDIAFSRDNRWAVTVSDDRLLTLWDREKNWAPEPGLAGHRSQVGAVAFSHDGRTIASGDDNGRLKLWNHATRQELFEIDLSPSAIGEIAFSDDGTVLACLLRNYQAKAGTTSVRLFKWYPTPDEAQPAR